jgi:hypothetical protein
MLTKEECEKALDRVARFCSWFSPYKCHENLKLKNEIDILFDLIEEHFDNQPLELEELKEGMFVWDNRHHTYIKIDRIWESYNKTIYFYAIGWECCENTEYEPNRFYRKEVQE